VRLKSSKRDVSQCSRNLDVYHLPTTGKLLIKC